MCSGEMKIFDGSVGVGHGEIVMMYAWGCLGDRDEDPELIVDGWKDRWRWLVMFRMRDARLGGKV
jgi:hypothetical protein